MQLLYCSDCKQMTNHGCCKCGDANEEAFNAGLERAAEICDELVRLGYTMASVGAHLCAAEIRKEVK